MPELPEVEITRRSLVDRIAGARVEQVHLGKPLRWPLGIEPASLCGARIGALARRGKYLWMPLQVLFPAPLPLRDGGLLMHLGMSGALRFESSLPPRGVHDHFELQTDRGTLRLTDPRRFGAVVWSGGIDQPPASQLLARLGVEPLSAAFTAAHLRAGLRGRRVAIKPALLAGDVVVGVGNIYCSEALHRAGIDPRTPAAALGPRRCERLVVAIRDTLQRALAAGGSTLRDFSDAHGMGGAFQHQAQVYDRAGLPCLRCNSRIQRLVQGQRATYYCARCQRR
ncbi:MAG: bifunctional DNA-formamidopyrimidine glycosylase/DNA-(apurinic or apyrimidinic site) lyase [Burkholderiales bacterium]